RALGSEGDTVTVTIGDFRDPNLVPLAAYYMNSAFGNVVEDETGRYPLSARNVYQVNGTAMGGGQSLAFSEAVGEGSMDSRLWRDDVELLQKPSDVGFSIEVLPRKFGGTLVDVGQGGQKLTLT